MPKKSIITRCYTADEEKELREEVKRQRNFKWGWYAVKDLHIEKNKLHRRWYTVFFKKKGEMDDKTTITVGKGETSHKRDEAEALALILNRLNAILE